MKISILPLLLVLGTLMQCSSHNVELTHTRDPDIIFVNIEDGDRSDIARLLEKIDSCQPAVVGIDVFFYGEKQKQKDSLLMQVLKQMKNDILIYSYKYADRKRLQSHSKFTNLVSDQGLVYFDDDEITTMVPLRLIEDSTHESFSLKIVKKWNPGFVHSFKKSRSYPIHYTRTLTQFLTIHGPDFDNLEEGLLKNKIVLVGYAGPGDEDKHYTPLARVIDHPRHQPDTYGIVILANEIRTILEYEKKE